MTDPRPRHDAAVSGMFGRIAGFYDLLNHTLSLGIDYYWRHVLARNVRVGSTNRVLDLAAGTLDVSLAIRRRFPQVQVPAMDFCPPMLQRGLHKLKGDNARAIMPVAADAKKLPLPDASWDAVLLDPPCSGWGTTDKNPQAIKRWQGDRLKPMLDLQRKLLTEASRLLRPGGKLVYSTCTTNVDENEGQVRFAVEGLGLEPIPLEPFPGFVFAAPELPGCEGTLRVDEGASNAQGFYIALLRKPGDSAAVPGLARGTAATAAYRAIPPAFLAEFGLSPALLPPGDLAVFEDSLHFLPAPALAHLPAAVRWQGMALGKASAQGLIPSARLRALLDPEPQRIPRLDVDDVPVLERLLQGGSLDTGLPGKEASLFWRGLPLGRLRLKAGRAVWSDR